MTELDVGCPKCGVKVGEKCVVPTSRQPYVVPWFHVARIVLVADEYTGHISDADRDALARMGVEIK